VYNFVKYFGSGVIIATAFIDLLAPALEELGSPCLSPQWGIYPYALALAMLSIFAIFIVEIVAFRWGMARLHKIGIGISPDAHGHHNHAVSSHADPPASHDSKSDGKNEDVGSKLEKGNGTSHSDSVQDNSVAAQVIGVAILEFGVLLHSFLIGLTLAVNQDFKVLFIVIVFHQIFEGLGIGSRLAYLKIPGKYNYVLITAAILYGISTPLGISIGLGIRNTYNPESTTASIVSGVLDALSAGILLYTGLVELLAHEFLFNKEMLEGSNGQIVYALTCLLFGCGIMSLLGRWA